MPGQLDQAKSNLGGLQDKLLGPTYDYSAQIKTPAELDMSSRGTFGALGNNISGLMDYVRALVTGKAGTHTGEPLGTKFFLPTMMKCKDVATGNKVTRSLYINNIPDGSIPFITTGLGGETFSNNDMKGLIPGIMSNLGQINPLQILLAFTSGGSSACQAITMETVDVNNNHSTGTGYVSNVDIKMMNSAWFAAPGQTSKPDTTDPEDSDESFATMHSNSSILEPKTLQGSKIDYSRMPNDFFIKIYLSSLGLLGLYIFLKMMLRKRLR
jgi:hypothetical protein